MDELLDRVLGGDAHARRVYADQLVEAGDPYGTYLQLVFGGQTGREAERLFNKHHRTWLGPDLAKILMNPVFEGGFLHTAAFRARRAADDATFARALASPLLRTLRKVEKRDAPIARYLDVLSAEACRGLDDVELSTQRLVDGFLARSPGCRPSTVRFGRLPPPEQLEHPVFDRLRFVVLQDGRHRAEDFGTRMPQLEVLWVTGGTPSLRLERSLALPVPEFRAGLSGSYRRFFVPGGVRLDIRGWHPAHAVRDVVDSLRDQLVHVHIVKGAPRIADYQQELVHHLRRRLRGVEVTGPS